MFSSCRLLGATSRRVAATGALALSAAAYATTAEVDCRGSARTQNAVLAPKHRVILTQWPALEDPTNGLTDLESLFRWCKEKGYDGIEVGADDMRKRFMPTAPFEEVVSEVRRMCRKHSIQVPGSLYHIADGVTAEMGKRMHVDEGQPGGERFDLDLNDGDFYEMFREKVARDKRMGNEYIDVHIRLPPRYLFTGGEYRSDESFLALSAERIGRIQQICFEEELNCYIETHMNMISEDPAGFCAIMDKAVPFEINADISHYHFRGIKAGRSYDRIVANVGHHHARMAEVLGRLSADVEDPDEDWANQGLTWQAFQVIKPALARGLSSRCIGGESGPMFAMDPAHKGKKSAHGSALALDAKLVPLYRMMARYADEQAQSQSAASASPFSSQSGAVARRERGRFEEDDEELAELKRQIAKLEHQILR